MFGDRHRIGVDIVADNVTHLAQRIAVDVTKQRQGFIGDIERQLRLTCGDRLFSPSTLCTSSTIRPMLTAPRIIGIAISETISMPSAVGRARE